MSVPKSRQSKSRLEVLYNATKLHDAIVALTLRSFGVYSRNSVLRHKYRTLIIQTKNEQYVDELVLSYKNLITQAANMIEVYLRQAKTIYPSNKTRLDLRMTCQNNALASCVEVKSILSSVARVFNVDLNLFEEPLSLVNREIKLIKNWQRSDINKFKKKHQSS